MLQGDAISGRLSRADVLRWFQLRCSDRTRPTRPLRPGGRSAASWVDPPPLMRTRKLASSSNLARVRLPGFSPSGEQSHAIHTHFGSLSHACLRQFCARTRNDVDSFSHMRVTLCRPASSTNRLATAAVFRGAAGGAQRGRQAAHSEPARGEGCAEAQQGGARSCGI